VINPGGRSPAVFRLDDGHVTKVRIEVGSLLSDASGSSGDRVTVTPVEGSTLQAGDTVVVGGQRGLLDGEAVESEAADGASDEGSVR
jgi:hypothetical protein